MLSSCSLVFRKSSAKKLFDDDDDDEDDGFGDISKAVDKIVESDVGDSNIHVPNTLVSIIQDSGLDTNFSTY